MGQMVRDDRFLESKFNKALMAVMLSVLAGVINTLIDTVFVSRRIGEDGIAAINLTMPLFLAFCTFGCLFGLGSSVIVTNALGRHNIDRARKYYHSAIVLNIIAGVIFFLIGVFFSEGVTSLLCGNSSHYDMVLKYSRVALMGAGFTMLSYIPSEFLVIVGKNRKLAYMMLIMIFTDIAFDYLFMYIVDMGVEGASIASVMSTYLAVLYGFSFLQEPDSILKLRFRDLKLYGVFEILRAGSSPALGTMLDAVRMYLLNIIIMEWGGTSALAVWGVINALSELSLCFIGGIPATGAPIIGVCRGSHDNEGVRMVIRYEVKNAIVSGVGYTLILVILHRYIGLVFNVESNMLVPLFCLGLSVIFEGMISILGSFFNVCGRIILSNTIMLVRAFVSPLVCAWLLFRGGGVIWYFKPLSMIAALASVLLITRAVAQLSKGTEHELSNILLMDDYMTKNNKVKSFSVISTEEKICEASEAIMDFCTQNNMEKKLVNRMGLAFEEIMVLMAEKSFEGREDSLDVRIYSMNDQIGISIMCPGVMYNPFKEAVDDDDMSLMGVRMISKMARDCLYLYVLDMNILEVDF